MEAKRFWTATIAAALLAATSTVSAQTPMGTAFSYQGQLKKAGLPVNDTADFEFTLWDASTAGNQVGPMAPVNNWTIENGLFTVTLDFGGDVFTGDARWLEIKVRSPAGGGNFTTLSPRQELTPAPYALALPGLWTQQNNFSPNVIGGYSGNLVTPGVFGATISGGGIAGEINQVTQSHGTIGGGSLNEAGSRATVGGGYHNIANASYATIAGGTYSEASAVCATVGGGDRNVASEAGATVAGGQQNEANGYFAAVGGGYANTASGPWDTVGGGNGNTASGGTATVGGGQFNAAEGMMSTVGGGTNNTGSTYAATVPGGQDNTAGGWYSFAAGHKAKVRTPQQVGNLVGDEGTFVWADNSGVNFESTGPNQFLIRASGGVGINMNDPEAALHIGGTPGVDGLMFPDGTIQTTAAAGGGDCWSLTGNSGTSPGTNFLGTTDDQPLVIKTNATEAVRIDPDGSVGIGTLPEGYWKLAVSHTTGGGALFTTTGTGEAGIFAIQTEANSNPALLAITEGDGQALYARNAGNGIGGSFSVESSDNANPALASVTGGTGNAASLLVKNPDNSSPALRSRTWGTGSAGYFEIDNAANYSPALEVTTNGTGRAIEASTMTATAGYFQVKDGAGWAVYGYNIGTGGAGHFHINNTANSARALNATTTGTGEAGVFWIDNTNSTSNALWAGTTGSGYAARFGGDVRVDGTLSKAGGGFKIDHPLDPENRYLVHSFVESPDMMNVYNGNVLLDENGEAVVQLPEWFGALNRDYRYQLTCIGGFAPVYVAEEITDNRFKIAGGKPGMKVSWQVTGIRQDAWATANRISVEVDKPEEERGKYLHPQALGVPEEMGLHYEARQEKLSRLPVGDTVGLER